MPSRISGALIAGAAVALISCGKQKGPPKNPPVPVAVTRVVREAVPFNITANGLVEPMQTAQVQAQVGGLLTRVTFKEGDKVQRGQVLFQIDPAPYQAALDQAEANLARDEATAANAAAEAKRYTTLVQQGYVTQEQTDQQVATARSSAALVKADSAALETARINLGWTTIRAPIAGKTGQLLVKQGNLIRGGTPQPLVLINQIQPILVHFAIPATSLPAIQQYAGKGALPVTVVPGIPPSAVAQGVSTGPTPAYTQTPSDESATEPVSSSNGTGSASTNGAPGDDPLPNAGGGGQTGTVGSGGHRRAGSATPGGPPSGPPVGTVAGPPAVSDGGTAGPAAFNGAPGGAGGQSAQGGRRPGSGGAGSTNGVTPGAPTSATPRSLPGLPGVAAPAPEHGSLSLVDNQVDTTTGTVLLKATFPNTSGQLWPGQFVATSLRLFVQDSALVVPAQAVMTGQQGTYVYLVDAAGSARQRAVTVERTSANRAVISAGLSVGDQVVTDGQSRLTPGAKVNIRGVVPPGAGGATPNTRSG